MSSPVLLAETRILIVDDEPLARERLQSLIEEAEAGHIVGYAGNGEQAIQLVQQEQPDIILLDIRMPGIDGIETARHLSVLDHPPAVIFTTAYGDHALEAFEAQAIDYVLKPIRKERLVSAINRARILTQTGLDLLEQTLPNSRTHLSAIVSGNIQLVPIEDVIYFKADQKYISVVYDKGEVLIEESLKSLESEFSHLFLRIHRSIIVARSRIKRLIKKGEGWSLELNGISETLPVSRRLRRTVMDYIR